MKNNQYQGKARHSSAIFQEWLREKNLTPDFALECMSDFTEEEFNDWISGKTTLKTDHMLALESFTNIPVRFWNSVNRSNSNPIQSGLDSPD